MMTVNKNYKDGLFRAIFNRPDKMLELYNALKGTDYGQEMIDQIEILTLDTAVYLGLRNDVGFSLGNTVMILAEHQSTICMNMPIRMVEYFGETLQRMFDKKVFGTKRLQVPTPEFYVFYNGTKETPYETIYRLSDHYIAKPPENSIEIVVKSINICYDEGNKLLEKCKTLKEYSMFINMVNKFAKEMELEEAVEKAIRIARDEGLLEGFLKQFGSEVIGMLNDVVTMEEYGELMKEEGREDGVRALISLVKSSKITVENAAESLNITQEEFKVYMEQYK